MSLRTATIIALATMALGLNAACGFFDAAPNECTQAADEAGLPDEMIEHLRNPEGLNALQRAALQQALRRAGIDDVCASLFDESSKATKPDGQPYPTLLETNTRKDTGNPDPHERRPEPTGSTVPPQGWPTSSNSIGEYAECLDEVFLRAHQNDAYYWFPAAVWYCRDLQHAPTEFQNPERCKLNQMRNTANRFPEWHEILHYWHALTMCEPPPTADTTHIGTRSNIAPTPYSACLDNAYLTHVSNLSDNALATGASAWLCQEHLPQPPDTHRLRCDLDHQTNTKELYPDWPEELHRWHAIMQCRPDWNPSLQPTEDSYTACLEDVYNEIQNDYDKAAGIAAAAWRCKNHMPDPPPVYNPRCAINHLQARDDPKYQWPKEMYAWNAMVQCYPAPK